jgi:hypothetical protein
MMWMMGNSIQIFSIFMVISGLVSPLMAIYRSGQGEQQQPSLFFAAAASAVFVVATSAEVLQQQSYRSRSN